MKILKAHISIIIAEIFWGLSAPVSKIVMNEGMTGLQLVTFRIIGACLLFWLVSLFLPKEKVEKRDYLLLAGAGCLAVIINQITFTVGLELTSPVNAAIMTTTMPLLTMFLAFFILLEPITWKKTLGIMLGATGVLLIVLHSNGSTSEKAGNIWGDILVIVAQLSFAFYLTLYKNFLPKYNGVTIMKWMFTFGLLATPFTGLSLLHFQWQGHTPDFWYGTAFVVVGATFFSYLFLMAAQKVLRPTIVSIYNYLQPVVACIVSIALGLGIFTLTHAIAILLVVTGVVLVMRSKSRAQQLEEQARQKARHTTAP